MSAFLQFLRAQEDGYEGDFEAYLSDTGLDELGGIDPIIFDDSTEEPVPRTDDDNVIEACVREMDPEMDNPWFTSIGEKNSLIMSVEHLLGVLEAMHVDNARIEIEGACEVPTLDGSGQPWSDAIAEVGLRFAPTIDEPVDVYVPAAPTFDRCSCFRQYIAEFTRTVSFWI